MMLTVAKQSRVTVEPAIEPIMLADLRDFARIYVDQDATTIESTIKAARKEAEELLGLQFITATLAYDLDYFPVVIQLPRRPLIAVSSITYVDIAGATQTLAATEYRVDTRSVIPRIEEEYGKQWPTTRDVSNAVTVTYTAGYGTSPTSVPEDYRESLRQYIAYRYDRRGEPDLMDAAAFFRGQGIYN